MLEPVIEKVGDEEWEYARRGEGPGDKGTPGGPMQVPQRGRLAATKE